MPQSFRKDYLTYDELTAVLKGWEKDHPDVCSLRSIGRSEQGREQWLLVLGPDPDHVRPTVWVDGNMHAVELCGSSVALAIAEDAIRIFEGENVHDLPAPVLEAIRAVRFFVLPRMSPDGAEAILDHAGTVRSVPRDWKTEQHKPHWTHEDVDGDGLALLMRQRDPSGDFVDSTEVPGLMLPRRIDDPGPYFRIYPEGRIENFDGEHVPDPYYLSDNGPDLNRNFPWSWAPEDEQGGAGPYPGSVPESRNVLAFTSEHPEIFAWLNLHTFGGVFIRPLGHLPDSKMEDGDRNVFRQLEQWGEELTGYPTVSGFEEFLYEPEKPLHGDLTDYAYHQRGCIAYVCELWDLFKRLGHERKKPFVEHYAHLSRAQLVALGKWAKENAPDVLQPWVACEHPQLGAVECGGIDSRYGISNPPRHEIDGVCKAQSAMFLRVAALLPRLELEDVAVEPLASGVTEIRGAVRNLGYLASFGLWSARKRHWNEPLVLEALGRNGAVVTQERTELGHIDGWGKGRFGGSANLFYMRSDGNATRRAFRLVVRGSGIVVLRAGSSRVGWLETTLEVG